MKKIILMLFLISISLSCKNNQKTEKEQKETMAPSKERQADHSKTKFVLFQSSYSPEETYGKMKDYLEEKGMFYPKLINHQQAAKNANIELKPIYLMVFGNPKMGAFLMQENPEVAIELPLKALIYQDNENRTWVMYKNMDYLKNLYFLKDSNGVIAKMNALQEGFKKAVYNPIHSTRIDDEELK